MNPTGRILLSCLVVSALSVASCAGANSPDNPTPSARIAAKAELLRSDLVALRRDIHEHPELSGSEVRTAALVEAHLRQIGLEVRSNVGGHGVVGVLRGALPGPVGAYRADMDAMPVEEPAGRPYGSTVPGTFHVCGHDLHTAIGVGIASVLASMRDQMHGTAVFFFQPAEETLTGAAAMIAGGALDDPHPDVVYAVHDFPLPVGTIAYGAVLAGLDKFTITLTGAEATQDLADRVATAVAKLGTVAPPASLDDVPQMLANLEAPEGPYAKAVFVRVNPPAIAGGLATIRGTVRAAADAMYPGIRDAVRAAVDLEAGAVAHDVAFADGPFPAMVSDPQVSTAAVPSLAALVGKENVVALRAPVPFFGEDFALFVQRVPGAMFFLGAANPERSLNAFPHWPTFDADEEAIVVGTKAMSGVLWARLESPR